MRNISGFRVFGPHPGAAQAAAALASRLGIPCFTDIKTAVFEEGRAVLEKRIYSGELSCAFTVKPPCAIALAPDFKGALPEGCVQNEEALLGLLPPLPLLNPGRSYDPSGDDLVGAELVIAAGRGIGSKQNFEKLVEIAGRLGAKAGATRAAVMNGWAPMSAQIGVSGVSLKARVCLVLGASGAGAFLAGLENCERVIAVNTDDTAPIFRRADFGLVADCRAVLEQLEGLLNP